jgi:hypothetical protein
VCVPSDKGYIVRLIRVSLDKTSNNPNVWSKVMGAGAKYIRFRRGGAARVAI